LFIKHEKGEFTGLLIYIDDIVLSGNSSTEITKLKHILQSNFRIKDLGELKYFLGLEVSWSDDGIFVSQRKCCLELLSDSTPMDSSLCLT